MLFYFKPNGRARGRKGPFGEKAGKIVTLHKIRKADYKMQSSIFTQQVIKYNL
ncbi:hypothetical protein BN871_FM_00090 [Paenibacillus sp. P22]|nr:hypothetical protein BN871_FM_00090 [Paenibacillus sp. P22]